MEKYTQQNRDGGKIEISQYIKESIGIDSVRKFYKLEVIYLIYYCPFGETTRKIRDFVTHRNKFHYM